MNPTHAHPSAPRSRLNSVVTIRSHRLFNSSAHAYPLRVVLPCVSSSFPIIRSGLGIIHLTAPPYRASAVAGHSLYSLIHFASVHFRAFFPWALPPLGYIICRPPLDWFASAALTRSDRSDTFQPFKRAARLFGIPLLPRSLSFFGLFQYWDLIVAGASRLRPFPVGRSKWKNAFCGDCGQGQPPTTFFKKF